MCALCHNRWHAQNNKILDLIERSGEEWIEGVSVWDDTSLDSED